jgi:hypothetical protein
MNSENSVNAELLTAEVKQPVGPGRGCIATLFCIGGTYAGCASGEWMFKLSQKGGPDESGSMGLILPSDEALTGAFLGGLAGLLVYAIVLIIANATAAQRNRVCRAILVVTLHVGIGFIGGALVGYAVTELANGAVLGMIIGLVWGAIVSILAPQ